MSDPVSPELADAGLPLQGVIAVEDLAGDTRAALAAGGVELNRMRSLVLLGQAGTRLWDAHVSRHRDRPDPFDDTSRELVAGWFSREYPGADWSILYPGEVVLPLGRLAEQAGWGRPSPLGLTIHAEYGLWIAHRVVVITEVGFAPTGSPGAAHPCDTCEGRPCVAACPAGAVSPQAFDVLACAVHRAPVGSTCEYRCLARSACPVGDRYRYGPEQMRHHYAAGLDSIRRWLQDGTGP